MNNKYNETEHLIEYVIRHYSYLFTRLESLGFKAAMADEKAKSSSSTMAKKLRDKWGAENNPEVVEALSEGYDAFKFAVYTRLIKEHKNEIFINRCPNCNKIVKTPKAKQCPWCFNSWHEKNV